MNIYIYIPFMNTQIHTFYSSNKRCFASKQRLPKKQTHAISSAFAMAIGSDAIIFICNKHSKAGNRVGKQYSGKKRTYQQENKQFNLKNGPKTLTGALSKKPYRVQINTGPVPVDNA